MSSIIRNRWTFYCISVVGRRVFMNDVEGWTYAGQHKGGFACGLGVATYCDGSKEYAEHGPDGQYDGRCLDRWSDGATEYRLFERGNLKDRAIVHGKKGRCEYNDEACARDDPRLLALIAQVLPVEVHPAAPAPYRPSARHSPPSNRPMDQPARFCPRRRSRRPWRCSWPGRCTPTSHAGPGWPCDTSKQRPQCNARPRSDALTGRFDANRAPSWTDKPAVWCIKGPSRQLRCVMP